MSYMKRMNQIREQLKAADDITPEFILNNSMVDYHTKLNERASRIIHIQDNFIFVEYWQRDCDHAEATEQMIFETEADREYYENEVFFPSLEGAHSIRVMEYNEYEGIDFYVYKPDTLTIEQTAFVAAWNAITKLRMFELEVTNKATQETDYVTFDIKLNEDKWTLEASHEAMSNEENESDKVSYQSIDIDEDLSIDENLEALLDACNMAIISSEFFMLP